MFDTIPGMSTIRKMILLKLLLDKKKERLNDHQGNA